MELIPVLGLIFSGLVVAILALFLNKGRIHHVGWVWDEYPIIRAAASCPVDTTVVVEAMAWWVARGAPSHGITTDPGGPDEPVDGEICICLNPKETDKHPGSTRLYHGDDNILEKARVGLPSLASKDEMYNILIHELGHAFGLHHTNGHNPMNPDLKYFSLNDDGIREAFSEVYG